MSKLRPPLVVETAAYDEHRNALGPWTRTGTAVAAPGGSPEVLDAVNTVRAALADETGSEVVSAHPPVPPPDGSDEEGWLVVRASGGESRLAWRTVPDPNRLRAVR